jgi:hypothetical protein
VNVPIDRQIQSWTTGTLPPDWGAIRDRWEFFHGLRTVISLFALACLFAGTLATATIVPITGDSDLYRAGSKSSIALPSGSST